MKTQEEITQEQELAFYSASVNAYYATKFEYDKSLLALSTGGIGLLFTLLTTVGVNSTAALTLYIVAIVCFLICLLSVLIIFNENGKLIADIISNPNFSDAKIVFLDKISKYSFGLAALLVVLISCSVALDSIIIKDSKMTITKIGYANDSISCIQNLKPSNNVEQKSVAGVQALKPSQSQPITQNQQTQALPKSK